MTTTQTVGARIRARATEAVYTSALRMAGIEEGNLNAVEEVMRGETGGCLDHLSRAAFRTLAIRSQGDLRALDKMPMEGE